MRDVANGTERFLSYRTFSVVDVAVVVYNGTEEGCFINAGQTEGGSFSAKGDEKGPSPDEIDSLPGRSYYDACGRNVVQLGGSCEFDQGNETEEFVTNEAGLGRRWSPVRGRNRRRGTD